MGIIIVILLIILLVSVTNGLLKKMKVNARTIDFIFFNIYCFGFIAFIIFIFSHQAQYHEQIDLIEIECYIPFGGKHIYSLVFYFLLYHSALLICWLRKNNLPPLLLAFSMSMLMVGSCINVFIVLQLLEHDLSVIPEVNERATFSFMILFPLFSLFVATMVCFEIIKIERKDSKDRKYDNKFLDKCNQLLGGNLLLYKAIFLCLPLLVVITIILVLFGQEYDSLRKAFTETATWKFSQHLPPPPKEHPGHYLCTVAASGSPHIVKPLREGNRHGYSIMVNRQLLIANAFEELIQDFSPKAHHIIRTIYDKYGYDLCKHITTAKRANLIYILMKPFEWLFLVFLYLFCLKPEQKITKQYKI